jgi:hypothetical protein
MVVDMTPPLFVTADPILLDELLRLAAAAGVTPEVAPDPPTALRSWASAPLVLVGVDQAAPMARIDPADEPGRTSLRGVRWPTTSSGRRLRSVRSRWPSCRGRRAGSSSC